VARSRERKGFLFNYLPYDERTPDNQYRDLLSLILRKGEQVSPRQEEDALMVFGHQMRFALANGFPIITERDLVSAPDGKSSQFTLALAELVAFLHGARTQEELKSFGVGYWSRWVTPEKCAKRGLPAGDLGPGSYGPAWRSFPTESGRPFDQITHLIEQIKELPNLRTHFVSPWIPHYLGRGKGKEQKVVVVPCHGWFHAYVNPERKELSLHHFQRSADVPVGLVFNFIQYAALTLMLAQVTGYRAKELVYTISDAHIYRKQMADVLEMVAASNDHPGRFPSVIINDPKIHDIFDFRPEHFRVDGDYHPKLPRRVIWTPV